ncbi:Glycosaminoglycan_polysaccharide lyase [Hexamita inflata]|uniref:Putative n=1 Tax=Hexamita inflata TaxID=28002 RepID=A0AA86RL90_9EUKA|nr:Glycosaminoglycan polysaccharide lyase [Hexamita inflata]CAI9974091.1 Glycosaminoglycan polysaccharide lyase [Hexamita inflata]
MIVLLCTFAYDKLQEKDYQTIIQNYIDSRLGIKYMSKYAATQPSSNQAAADKQISKMLLTNDRAYIFPEYPNLEQGGEISNSLSQLLSVAIAYATPPLPNSPNIHYRNITTLDIIQNALTFIVDKQYILREYIPPKRNNKGKQDWYDWQIGIPRAINDILMTMGQDISDELLTKLVKSSRYYQPNSTHTGPIGLQITDTHFPKPVPIPSTAANLASITMITFLRGIVSRNQTETDEAFTTIPSILEITTSYDGFFKDGSFIQHRVIPYTQGYGAGLLGNVVEFMSLLIGQDVYSIRGTNIAYIFTAAINTYTPILYNGQIIPITIGRMVANSGGFGGARSILASFAYLAEFGDSKEVSEIVEVIKSIIKYHVITGRPYDDHSKYQRVLRNREIIGLIEANKSIIPFDPRKLYNFASMNRVVQKREHYSFSIAMCSYRISGYEADEDQNLKGWYSGDGVEYLMMKNQRQFVDFWPTVDSYQFQGISETLAQRAFGDMPARPVNTAKFVGGAIIDNFGSIGFEFINYDKSLKTNKSYFLFDQQIVVLMSGFDSKVAYRSTFLNHMIENVNQQVAIDKTAIDLDKLNTLESPKQIFVQGTDNVNNLDNLAIYFMNQVKINLIKETRTGKWADVAGTASTADVKRIYAKGYVENTTKLEYILFPNAQTDTADKYEQNQFIKVISNTGAFQAINNTDPQFGANNYYLMGNLFDGTQTIEGFTFTAPVSFVIKRENSRINLSVSDPTQLLASTTITKRENFKADQFDSKLVSVDNQNVLVNTKDYAGASIYVSFNVMCLDAQPADNCQFMSGFTFPYKNGTTIWYQSCPANAVCDTGVLKCNPQYLQVFDMPECQFTTKQCVNAQIVDNCVFSSGFTFLYKNGSTVWYQQCPANAVCTSGKLVCSNKYQQVVDKPECEIKSCLNAQPISDCQYSGGFTFLYQNGTTIWYQSCPSNAVCTSGKMVCNNLYTQTFDKPKCDLVCVHAQIVNNCVFSSGFTFQYKNGSTVWYQHCPPNAVCDTGKLACTINYVQVVDKPICVLQKEESLNLKSSCGIGCIVAIVIPIIVCVSAGVAVSIYCFKKRQSAKVVEKQRPKKLQQTKLTESAKNLQTLKNSQGRSNIDVATI